MNIYASDVAYQFKLNNLKYTFTLAHQLNIELTRYKVTFI